MRTLNAFMPLLLLLTSGSVADKVNTGHDFLLSKSKVGPTEIGSTLGQLRQHYKVDRISSGEGSIFASVAELSMSFGLDLAWAAVPSEWWKSRDQAIIPNDAKIASILVLGPSP